MRTPLNPSANGGEALSTAEDTDQAVGGSAGGRDGTGESSEPAASSRLPGFGGTAASGGTTGPGGLTRTGGLEGRGGIHDTAGAVALGPTPGSRGTIGASGGVTGPDGVTYTSASGTRLTNAFSKKLRNHAAAIALHFMHYNFVRIHQTLRVTSAMAAGVTDHAW